MSNWIQFYQPMHSSNFILFYKLQVVYNEQKWSPISITCLNKEHILFKKSNI